MGRALDKPISQDIVGLDRFGKDIPGMVYQFQMTADGHMSFRDISPSAESLYEQTREDLLKYPELTLGLIPEEEREGFRQAVLKSARELSTFLWTGKMLFPDGRQKWITAGSTPHREPDGCTVWDGVVIDITAQKEAESRLQSERDRALASSRLISLGQMAAGIAHEINNPLTVINGEVEDTLSSLGNSNYGHREVFETILKMGNRISRIVKSLKQLAREGGSDPFDLCSVQEIIDDTVVVCQKQIQNNGICLEINLESPDQLIECRPVQISQTLLNLIGNSVDAVDGLEDRWIRVSTRLLSSSTLSITVEDSGPGVAKEHQAQLMEPFFSTKDPDKGTGLGLAISLACIKAHSGRFFYNPKASHTQFVIHLPTQQRESSEKVKDAV